MSTARLFAGCAMTPSVLAGLAVGLPGISLMWLLFIGYQTYTAALQKRWYRAALEDALRLQETGRELDATRVDKAALESARADQEARMAVLQAALDDLSATGACLEDAASDITEVSEEQKLSLAQQARAARQVLGASKGIAHTSQALAQTVEGVARSVDEAAQLAGSGGQALRGMQETMLSMVGGTEDVAARLSVLSERAERIGGVVTTITQVADLTNLLSLNAAIEAEKAGQAGGGFSVVASEIRRLADQTAVAALDIERIVMEMQASVSDGVLAMEELRREAHSSRESVGRVVRQLEKIIERVQGMAGSVDEVTQGMGHQASRAESIAQSIEEIMVQAQGSAQAVSRYESSITNLQEVARVLHHTLAQQLEAVRSGGQPPTAPEGPLSGVS